MTIPTTGGGARKERGKSHRNGGNGSSHAPAASLPPGRVPPHNLDAEKSLLGGILLDRQAPLKEVAEICGAADLYRDAHRKIFEAMLSLLEDGIPVDRVTVLERLTVRGDLDAAGGEEYLEQLDNFCPTAANLLYYAKIVRDKARARRMIETTSAIAQLGYEQHGDVADFIAEAERRMRSVVDDGAPAKTSTLPSKISLSRELLRAVPPRREYMLKDAKGTGIFVQGKIGLLAAPGGTGKSWALAGAAVSVATGLPWFGDGGWEPTKPGRVLFIMAEEDQDEVLRLVHHTAKAMGATSDEDLDLLARNIDLFGMAGFGVSLTMKDPGMTADLPETVVARNLREAVRKAAVEHHPYTLIILDPLSRFAGVDTEKDPPAATRWVQVVETFTSAELGRPSVIVSCHTRKSGVDGPDENRQNADWIRGTTALRDAVRWAAIIEQKKRLDGAADLLTLRIVKANGVPPQFSPLYLCRDRSHEGCLRVATPAEIASHDKEEKKDNAGDGLEACKARVLEVVKPGQAYSKSEIAELIKGKDKTKYAAINILVREKELCEVGRGRSTKIMLDMQPELGLAVPTVPAPGSEVGKGTEESSSGAISPPAVPGGNSRELTVPGTPSSAVASSDEPSGSPGSRTGSEEEPPPHTDEDAR